MFDLRGKLRDGRSYYERGAGAPSRATAAGMARSGVARFFGCLLNRVYEENEL